MDANALSCCEKPFKHELGGKTTKTSFACDNVDEVLLTSAHVGAPATDQLARVGLSFLTSTSKVAADPHRHVGGRAVTSLYRPYGSLVATYTSIPTVLTGPNNFNQQ